MNKVIRLFLDVDMRLQHAGLVQYASENKVDLKSLSKGEHVVFINHALNRVKVFSPNGVLTYLYRDKGRIDLNAFSEIATAFSSDGSIDFNKRLERLS